MAGYDNGLPPSSSYGGGAGAAGSNPWSDMLAQLQMDAGYGRYGGMLPQGYGGMPGTPGVGGMGGAFASPGMARVRIRIMVSMMRFMLSPLRPYMAFGTLLVLPWRNSPLEPVAVTTFHPLRP